MSLSEVVAALKFAFEVGGWPAVLVTPAVVFLTLYIRNGWRRGDPAQALYERVEALDRANDQRLRSHFNAVGTRFDRVEERFDDAEKERDRLMAILLRLD